MRAQERDEDSDAMALRLVRAGVRITLAATMADFHIDYDHCRRGA